MHALKSLIIGMLGGVTVLSMKVAAASSVALIAAFAPITIVVGAYTVAQVIEEL
jgi:hypothetical protein